MKKTNKSVYNIKDFKDSEGMWISTYTVTTDMHYIQNWTRAFRLWVKINGRCSNTGYISKDRPSYGLSENHFPDFQSFADWCQDRVGYNNVEDNGKYWSLDKDILHPGNKIYSSETCCFVPNKVNQIFTSKFDINKSKIELKTKKIIAIEAALCNYTLDERVIDALTKYKTTLADYP